MATSSIIENISVNNPKVMEQYAEAMEKAEKSTVTRMAEPTAKVVTAPEEMRNLMLQGIKKWSKA